MGCIYCEGVIICDDNGDDCPEDITMEQVQAEFDLVGCFGVAREGNGCKLQAWNADGNCLTLGVYRKGNEIVIGPTAAGLCGQA